MPFIKAIILKKPYTSQLLPEGVRKCGIIEGGSSWNRPITHRSPSMGKAQLRIPSHHILFPYPFTLPNTECGTRSPPIWMECFYPLFGVGFIIFPRARAVLWSPVCRRNRGNDPGPYCSTAFAECTAAAKHVFPDLPAWNIRDFRSRVRSKYGAFR